MDFNILYAIQSMRTELLDQIVLFITNEVGKYGYLWIGVGALMCPFNKTRKCGFSVLLSYVLVFLLGHLVLKDLIGRIRPCVIDQTVELLVQRPTSYSCPSTHTSWSFAAAAAIFMYHKKTGIAALVLASIIGFTRMYLFVHFPTDVLFGLAFGVIIGVLSAFVVKKTAAAIFGRKTADRRA